MPHPLYSEVFCGRFLLLPLLFNLLSLPVIRMWQNKLLLLPFHFRNNFVKPHSILINSVRVADLIAIIPFLHRLATAAVVRFQSLHLSSS